MVLSAIKIAESFAEFGSLFAAMIAINIGGVDSAIMVSPSYEIFEGSDSKNI